MQELLFTLFYIAEKNGVKLCFNPSDGLIYKVLDRSNENATLLPLRNGDAPVCDFEPQQLIFIDTLKNMQKTDFNGILTAFNGLQTDVQRITTRNTNGITTATERNTDGQQTALNGTTTEQEQQTIGRGKTDLPRFSILYTGQTAAAAVAVEDLLQTAINNTNKQQTINNLIKDYDNAKKLAAAGQVYELRLLEKKLQGITAKQQAMRNGVELMKKKAAAKRRAILATLTAAAIAACYFWNINGVNINTSAHIESNAAQIFETVTENKNIFDEAVLEYETETGRRIYPAGRECLRKATRNCTTKNEVLQIIKKNM